MVKKTKYSHARRSSNRFSSKRVVISLVALAVLITALELTNTTHIFHKQKVPAVIPSVSTNSNAGNPASTKNYSLPVNSQSSSSKSPSLAGSTTTENLVLINPYGDFVSNHHPGGDTPLDEVSVCNTTPGATCYIKFTSGQTTTQLPAQVAGSDGSARWSWNVDKDAHLSSGEWQISAVAALNGQTKSTDDQIKLEVK